MAYKAPNIPEAVNKKEFNWNIESFRGVDFSANPLNVDKTRSPSSINIIQKDGYPVCRNGYKPYFYDPLMNSGIGGNINGLYVFKGKSKTEKLCHIGTRLYKYVESAPAVTTTLIKDGFNDKRSVSKQIEGVLYILDGANYWQYDGTEVKKVVGYIPVTSFARTPQGGGTYLYATNLIQNRRKNKFLADGKSNEYQLNEDHISSDPVIVGVLDNNGNMVYVPETIDLTDKGFSFTVDCSTGVAKFSHPPYETGYTYLRVIGIDNIGNETGIQYNLESNKTQKEFKITDSFLPLRKDKIVAMFSIANSEGTYLQEFTVAARKEDVNKVIDGCFLVNRDAGIVTFREPPSNTPIAGWDNIEIEFAKNDEFGNRIAGCDIITSYGYNGAADRLVVAGNPKLPNWDFISAVNDPTYFPSTHYSIVGDESTQIMGYSLMTDGKLAIHKEYDGINPTIYYRDSTLINNEQLFPVKEGPPSMGVISKYCFENIDGDPVSLSRYGVFATVPVENSSINEKYAQRRSLFIDNKLNKEPNLSDAVSIYHKGFYYLAVNDHVYIADSTQKSKNILSNDWQYEWYYWEHVPVRIWYADVDDNLYFGTKDGKIMKFTEDFYQDVNSITQNGTGEKTVNYENISCHWYTPLTDLGSISHKKNIKYCDIVSPPYDRTSVNMNINYNDPYERSVLSSNNLAIFNFWDIDFNNFSFDTNPNPQIIAIKEKAKKVDMVSFKFWANSGKPFGFYRFLCVYTMGGRIKN